MLPISIKVAGKVIVSETMLITLGWDFDWTDECTVFVDDTWLTIDSDMVATLPPVRKAINTYNKEIQEFKSYIEDKYDSWESFEKQAEQISRGE